MNRRKLLSLAAAAPLLSGCDPFLPRYSFRYRLKISAVIGGRRYEASSVNETKYTLSGWGTGFDGVGAYHGLAWGQAIIVDLGSLGLLFGLLEPPVNMDGFWAKHVAEILLNNLPPSQRKWDDIRSGRAFERVQELHGEYDVARSLWPVLVRFSDVHERNTVELVTPRDFRRLYGPDAELTAVTIALTTDPLSAGIEKKLPWLLKEDRRIDRRSTRAFSETISRFNFISNGAVS